MTDYSKVAFDSRLRYEHLVDSGSETVTIAASGFGAQTTLTIAHNLGYEPYFRLKYSFNGTRYYDLSPGLDSYDIAANGKQVDNIEVDSSNITVTFSDFANSAQQVIVAYRIYAEPK